MADLFYMDKSGIKKLERFFRESPNLIKPVVANVLTSLAFQTRKNDIRNIGASMIIRNRRFMESSLRFDRARSGPIESMISRAYSIRRGSSFTGWKEQTTGAQPERKRLMTKHARGGSKQSAVKQRFRLRASNKIYKPDQFQGRDLKSSFQFMMRVLGSRGGGEFLIDRHIPTKRGALGKGLYSLRNGRVRRLQDFETFITIRRNDWRKLSLQQLRSGNTIKKIWAGSIEHILRRYR